MEYKVIIVNLNGASGQSVIALIEGQMNLYAQEGYRFVGTFSPDVTKTFIIMGKNPEKRGPGRPRKDDGEVVSMGE